MNKNRARSCLKLINSKLLQAHAKSLHKRFDQFKV